MSALPRLLLLALLLFTAWVVADGIGVRKLGNPDEGRYSEISREMAASGDFVTPRLNDLKYFEKPPLQYWATAIAFKLFGESDFTARLYITLCAFGTLLLILYTGARIFDWETGLYATLALMGMPFFMAASNVIILDVSLTFWMTLALCSYALAQVAQQPFRRRWLWVFWAAMAAAVLSKGLIGVIFPAAAIFLYALFPLDLRRWQRLDWLRGLAIFFTLSVPWHILVSSRNAEFAHFYFIHEHFERFLTTEHHRVSPWWIFIPILLLGVLPWCLAIFPAVVRGWQRPGIAHRDETAFRPLRFFLLFSVFLFTFFSASGSKLPHYILPLFPPLALVMGAWLKEVAPPALAKLTLPVVLVLVALAAYMYWGLPATREDAYSRQLYEAAVCWGAPALLLQAVATLVAFFLLRGGRRWLGVLLVAGSSFVAVELIKHGYERVSPLQSSYALAQSVAPQLLPQTRLYSVRNYEQSLPFYLKRTMTLVDYVDEFELGEKQEPDRYLPKIEQFVRAWNEPGPAIAIIQPGDIDQLNKAGLVFDIIHQDPVRVAIRKKT